MQRLPSLCSIGRKKKGFDSLPRMHIRQSGLTDGFRFDSMWSGLLATASESTGKEAPSTHGMSPSHMRRGSGIQIACNDHRLGNLRANRLLSFLSFVAQSPSPMYAMMVSGGVTSHTAGLPLTRLHRMCSLQQRSRRQPGRHARSTPGGRGSKASAEWGSTAAGDTKCCARHEGMKRGLFRRSAVAALPLRASPPLLHPQRPAEAYSLCRKLREKGQVWSTAAVTPLTHIVQRRRMAGVSENDV